MGFELPIYSGIIARLNDPTINLAAFGGIVYPLAILIESPVIMLLAASTAMCTNTSRYAMLRSFMLMLGIGVTLLHASIAFTPLFEGVVASIINPPEEVLRPARVGLMLAVAWPFCIGCRRFNQGILIRYGKSKLVGLGSVLRLVAGTSTALILGALMPGLDGVLACSAALSTGVVAEAIFSALCARPLVRNAIPEKTPSDEELTWRSLLAFYVPLAMTPLLLIAAQPIISTAMSRMSEPLDSLAAWPVVAGLTFTFRSLGVAFNEVVISLIAAGENARLLAKFTQRASLLVSCAFLLLLLTPARSFLLETAFALPENLHELCELGLWICCLLPGLNFYQSWYMGVLLSKKKTIPIVESVLLFLVVAAGVLGWGVMMGNEVGLVYGAAAYALAMAIRTLWLQIRSRAVRTSYHLDNTHNTASLNQLAAN